MVAKLFILQAIFLHIKLFMLSYNLTSYNNLHQCAIPVTKVNNFPLTHTHWATSLP